jgi:hypothetical protein
MTTTPFMRRTTKEVIARIQKVVDKYVEEGLSLKDARERAYLEARDNPRKDVRRKTASKAKGKKGKAAPKVGMKKGKAVRKKGKAVRKKR